MDWMTLLIIYAAGFVVTNLIVHHVFKTPFGPHPEHPGCIPGLT